MCLEAATADGVRIVLRELGVDRDELQKDVLLLREWLEKQPHLPQRADDKFLIKFILGCKSVERAKERIDAYYTVRWQMKPLFRNRDPTTEEFIKGNEGAEAFFLPKLTKRGERICITRFLEGESDKLDARQFFMKALMVADIGIIEDPFTSGTMAIVDFANCQPHTLTKFTPTLVKNMMICIQNVLPYKIKALVFFNSNTFVKTLVNNLVKPLLKKKLSDRLFVYSEGAEVLEKHLSVDILPSDYGGTQLSCTEINDLWMKKLANYRRWFLTDGNETANETKRIGKGPFKEIEAGIEGTFRTLNID